MTHLVTGVAGQDGVLLARRLLADGHDVVGTVLPGSLSPGAAPPTLPYLDGVRLVEHDVRDADGFAALLKRDRPSVVHNLAAISSVGDSWEQERLTREVDADAVVAMLEVLRKLAGRGHAVRFVQASSSEIFGRASTEHALDEHTPLAPVSPYGRAKATAHEAVRRARDDGLWATNIVLFSHTGPLHAGHFAVPSAVRQAAEVALGRRDRVVLRDPAVRRDWGGADDYVDGWLRAAGVEAPGDVVLATGRLHSLGEVAGWALDAALGPGHGVPVAGSGEPARPQDLTGVRGDASRARELLGWEAVTPLEHVVRRMVAVDLRRLETGVEEDPAYLEL